MLNVSRNGNNSIQLVDTSSGIAMQVQVYATGKFSVKLPASHEIARKSGYKNIAFAKPVTATAPAQPE